MHISEELNSRQMVVRYNDEQRINVNVDGVHITLKLNHLPTFNLYQWNDFGKLNNKIC
jgi:hypothetical protein